MEKGASGNPLLGTCYALFFPGILENTIFTFRSWRLIQENTTASFST